MTSASRRLPPAGMYIALVPCFTESLYFFFSCAATSFHAESDVDIVIRCDDFFSFDLDELTPVAKNEFHKAFSAATYTLSDFR